MPPENPPPPPPNANARETEAARRFALMMQSLQATTLVNQRVADNLEALCKVLAHPKNGAIAAGDDLGKDISDLVIEIRAMRKDMALLRVAIQQIPGITLFGSGR